MIISDEAWPYLVAQRGVLDVLKGARPAWEAAYRLALADEFASLEPFLPGGCRSILDIGGGMGGIDVLLSRHYGNIAVSILDGADDPPVMRAHARTFSHAGVARRFLQANGVRAEFLDPTALDQAAGPFDLVVSLASWGFHYPPAAYLAWLTPKLALGATVIVDLRRDRADWEAELAAALEPVEVAARRRKFNRTVWRARAA